MGYALRAWSAGCLYLNTTTRKLESDGMDLGACSTPAATQCFSTHLTDFMASFYVPPISFDPTNSGFANLDDNPIAFALCLAIICFYFIVIIWARRKDRDDMLKAGLIPLPDNDPRDDFRYELTIWTGRRAHAGTTARVSLIFSGEDSDTAPRLLTDPLKPTLQQSNIDSFLMTTPEYLGRITCLRIWHDNTGNDPSWYFSRMLVEDLQTGDKYYFINNRWLAFDQDDGMVDRILPVSGKEEINGFENVFWTRGSKNLYDGHLWFSVVTRPPRSKFTRVQRASACLSLLMYTMMVNLMFYQQTDNVKSPQVVEIGPIKITPSSVFLATVSSLIIIPINVLIVILFRDRRERHR